MHETLSPAQFQATPLTKELAQQYATELTALASQIPLVEYTQEEVLAEQKGERQMLNKWQHSLVVLDEGKPIAFIMGYERQGEGTEQYPANTLYISELAVAQTHQGQGVATSLLQQFFEYNNNLGFQTLDGDFNYSLQTNSAEWNNHVINLYKSFGFKQRAFKNYDNRVDVVLGVQASELQPHKP